MEQSDALGKLLLRLTLGILVLMHGLLKLSNVDGTMQWLGGALTAQGLPAILAWGVFLGEVLGPVLLIVGFFSRVGAALVALNMIAALYLVHQSDLLVRAGNGGWALELQGMYLFTAIAILLMGPGRYALNQR